MNKDSDHCFRCGIILLDEIELDTNCCERCADILYEKSQEQREWDYYHPNDKE